MLDSKNIIDSIVCKELHESCETFIPPKPTDLINGFRGIDSLSFMEIIIGAENFFGKKLTEQEILRIKTFKDLYDSFE